MNREKIVEFWGKYIKGLFKGNPFGELPYMYQNPHCATCTYWQIFGGNELEVMSETMFDLDYDDICRGIKGELNKIHYDSDGGVDCYQDHRFFGFCKRYPPLPNNDDQFTVKPKPLFVKADRYIFEFKYPITDQEQWCGEWKRGAWYWCEKEFIDKMYGEGELSEEWKNFFKE